MSIINQDFFIFPEDVYRVGNFSSHRLTALRGGEVDIYEMKGIQMVIANGKGVSVFTIKGLKDEGLTGYAWLFTKGTSVEHGLKLIDDNKPEHYTLAPFSNMPLDEFKGLLEKMGMKCAKYLKIKKDGSMERTA
jgi:hypothetical protein